MVSRTKRNIPFFSFRASFMPSYIQMFLSVEMSGRQKNLLVWDMNLLEVQKFGWFLVWQNAFICQLSLAKYSHYIVYYLMCYDKLLLIGSQHYYRQTKPLMYVRNESLVDCQCW